MVSVDFPERTAIIAEEQDEFLNLYAYSGQVGPGDNEKGVIMCFELSEEELEEVIKFRRIWYLQLTYGESMNPISHFVTNNLFNPIDRSLNFQQHLSLQKLEEIRAKWAAKTFPRANLDGVLNHLKREIQEFEEDPSDISELADMLMLVMDAGRLSGHSADDILKAFSKKHIDNTKRKWALLPDGSYTHVK